MKQRNLLKTVILGYVTLGIYALYWLISTRRGLVEKLQDKKAIPSVWLLFMPLFIIIFTVIFAIMMRSSAAANIMMVVVYGVALIASPIITIYWFYKYSNALHKVTNGTDPILHLVLMIIMRSVGLGPVWVLLAQNDINKYLDASEATNAPVVPAANAYGQSSFQSPASPVAAVPPAQTQPQPPVEQPIDQNRPTPTL